MMKTAWKMSVLSVLAVSSMGMAARTPPPKPTPPPRPGKPTPPPPSDDQPGWMCVIKCMSTNSTQICEC